MNRVLKINIYFGTEQILRYFSIFEKLLANNCFDIIQVSLSKELLLRIRSDIPNVEAFYQDYYTIMRWIFNHPKIEVVDDQSFPLICYTQLVSQYGQRMSYYINEHLVDESIGSVLKLPTKYITISTKIWSNDINTKYDSHKGKILDSLNAFNHNIVILGERNIAVCDEYTKILTRSIYRDLTQALKKYTDYTYNDSSQNNEINKLKQSFYILSRSSLNIFITDSGIRITNLFLNKNVIGLTNCYEMSTNDIVHFNPATMCFTNNPDTFVETLNAFIHNLNICS